jgi:ribonucleoside-triphosphate reductase
MEPPSDFESALSIAFNVFLHASKETNRVQICNYFNIFLAPFAKGADTTRIKENLRLFILNLNQHTESTLVIELSIPKSTAAKEAVGPLGKIAGKYGDFGQESQNLATIVCDVFLEENIKKPLLNPKLIIKINQDSLADDNIKEILLKAHRLAAERGIPYFANITKKETENTVFSPSGTKLSSDLTGDWETDTLRTGCLGYVTINLPRITQESEKDKNKFFELVRERFEIAARAIGIKNNALKQFGKNSLPFLLKSSSGDTYFRLENCSRIVNLAGFREAIEAFTEKSISSEESRKFVDEIIQNLLAFKQKIGRKYGKRLYPVILSNSEASERLAQLDVEKYGVAKVKFSGTREKPYYSTARRFQVKGAETLTIPPETFELAPKFKGLNAGGTLDIIELDGAEVKPEALMDLTRRLIENQSLEFFTYNRIISYCDNCKKSWFGTLHKCQFCGSMSALSTFDRFPST